MASNFVIRQDGLQILSLTPGDTEFLAIQPDGVVTTTGVTTGSLANIGADVAVLSGAIDQNTSDIMDLQTDVAVLSGAIDAIEQESTVIQSSGGSIIVTENPQNTWNVEVASSPIQNHNSLLGLQGGVSGQYFHLTAAEYADYIGSSEVAAVSGFLQTQITVNAAAIAALGLDVIANTANISANAADIADLQNDFGNISADVAVLSGAIDQNASDIDDLETATAGITGGITQLDGLYVNADGDTMTGPLSVPDLTVTNNAVVNGNLYVNGDEFIVDTITVSAADNIIEINGGEVGPGVTAGYAGIRVDRGSADDYYFLFDEQRDAFAIGSSTVEASAGLSQLQLVATREDNPTDSWIAVWNDSENRFDTVDPSTLAAELSGSFVQITGDTMTGDLNLSSANLNVTDGVITIDGTTFDHSENLAATIGTEIVDSFDENLGYGAEWLVTIRSTTGTNIRTSKVYAAWDRAGDVCFTEVGTNDIGSTANVTLDVVENANNIELRAIIAGGLTWEVKSIRTVL